MRKLADSDSSTAYVAVSHSDQASTDEWLRDVGGAGKVEVIVDFERALYGAWGLGASSFWHVLNPTTLGAVRTTSQQDGIDVRPTNTGTRWQKSGTFGINGQGKVTSSKPADTADEIPDLEQVKNSTKA